MEGKNHFIIAGAQRSGTTLLYKILDDNSNIIMAKPLKPESKFFLKHEELSEGYQYYFNKYFKGKKGYVWYGEKSTSYMEMKDVPKKIKTILPDARIIFILRNPVYRAISNYYFTVQNRIETRDIEDVFLNDVPPPSLNKEVSVSPFKYIERGFYQKYLENYFKYFNSNKIKIIILEKISLKAPDELLSLFSFLNISSYSGINKYLISNINSNLVQYENFEFASIKEKLEEIYMNSIEDLEFFLNVDLSVWKNS